MTVTPVAISQGSKPLAGRQSFLESGTGIMPVEDPHPRIELFMINNTL
jgi:hypothetical protein